MPDFFTVMKRYSNKGTVEVYPEFIIMNPSKDLMIRGGDFYAVWDEDKQRWSTKENDALRIIDKALDIYVSEHHDEFENFKVKILYTKYSSTKMIDNWHKYVKNQMRDSYHPLDEQIIFSNAEVRKEDYASKTLSYPFESCPTPAYDELIGTLYSDDERMKIEWTIGAIISGDSKQIQKFLVMYGPPSSGKSTILNIMQLLFDGYYSTFDSKALGQANNPFALEAFRDNPLLAIQHDGDLSHIEDNTRLNSLVSHELMSVNAKYEHAYTQRFNSFLVMGTNKPVRITDAKSGILRRLIDVTPSGKKIERSRYDILVENVRYELGGIAAHCLEVYKANKKAYDSYVPLSMMGATNDFYNFMLDSYDIFKRDDCTTLKIAWEMYNDYAQRARIPSPYSQRVFKEELKNYFRYFEERSNDVEGRPWNYYHEFLTSKFQSEFTKSERTDRKKKFIFNCTKSLFDKEFADCPAQYGNRDEKPTTAWANVTTKLSDISTSEVHYVKVPVNHIVIDFDIPDADGNKCFELNSIEAEKWPETYAELSKSGQGIHLHYNYAGDPTMLSNVFAPNIEVKVFKGGASLRRKLTKCNNLPIATISSGLPLKEKKKVLDENDIKDEKHLRARIKYNLEKKSVPSTTQSMKFIFNDTEEAYSKGIHYDISNMEKDIYGFANSSKNHKDICLEYARKIHYKSKEPVEAIEVLDERPIVIFDLEVAPNVSLCCWKPYGKGKKVRRMFNPTPIEIENLCKYKLVGFNNRRYDNHILMAMMMGASTEEIFKLSGKIVNTPKGKRNDALYPQAYNLSELDLYDVASKKQSLKKWEIELHQPHQEFPLKWDEPVPEDQWEMLADYCCNDVLATEAVYDHLQPDILARKILVEICKASGLRACNNDTTNSLTTKIIFGNEQTPKLVYTNLATGESEGGEIPHDIVQSFPGYEFIEPGNSEDGKAHNMFMGEDVGKGGYVYAEPGMYTNVALLDIQSMHPSSIINMNMFGDYTPRFKDIYDTRVLVKHHDYESAKKLMNGILAPYLEDDEKADQLAQALKIAINSVYGLTSAKFPNPFNAYFISSSGKNRNENNIVALRGALFMVTLKHEVQKRGFTVAHIKTDSIKIPNATPEIIEFCNEFAAQYGYIFDHEATYEKMCLVNDAVYVAKYATMEKCYDIYGPNYVDRHNCLKDNRKHGGEWTATGTQFQVPYVFKTLFSHEPLIFDDYCETKEVKDTAMYLDFNEGLPEDQHAYHFVGRVGLFCPMQDGCNAAQLLRADKDIDGKYSAVVGTKGYKWMEADYVKGKLEDKIDISYYRRLADDALDTISKFGDPELFRSDDEIASEKRDIPPFDPPYTTFIERQIQAGDVLMEAPNYDG